MCNRPLVGGEIGYKVDEVCVNPDTVSYQERLTGLYDSGLLERLRSRRSPIILEVGSGYGALAFYIKRILPHARLYLVDIPTSLMFAGCYLVMADPLKHIQVVSDAARNVVDYGLVAAGNFGYWTLGQST